MRYLILFFALLVLGCGSPVPFEIVISPASAQPYGDDLQPLPYFDSDGWLIGTSIAPLRYPIQLEASAVITGWTLDLWREDQGPNTSGVLERLHRAAPDDPGNSTELHDRVTDPVDHQASATLAIDDLDVPVGLTGPLSVALRGNGVAGDRALALYVRGYLLGTEE